jgi:4-diphosphocytidyl-2-C-methyl-D-erythritol kinase
MPENDDTSRLLAESAPAKLNLSLRVVGKRDDGFHEIETLMLALPGLADRVSLAPGDGFAFECDAEGVPSDDRNLAVRAVRVFEEATGLRIEGRLRLEKRIPHGAGLGGGSSDAAAVLRLLAKFHGGVGEGRLHEMAARIGSDVPFFLRGGAAWCRGRGERIEPAAEPPPLHLLLLKPWFGVDTPDAYRRWKDAEPLPGVDFAPQHCAAGELVNDLERPVFAKHLFLAEMKGWLRARPEVEAALMSGSGSTVFGVLRPGTDAGELAAAARRDLDSDLWWWAG